MRILFLVAFFVGYAINAHAFQINQQDCDNRLDCAARSVVSLLPDWPSGFSRNEEPEGSGIVVGNGMLIATADHVLGPAKSARIRTWDGRILKAEIVMRNPLTDVAFLEVADALLAFKPFSEVAVSQTVCAIGNSFGLDISVTCGVVSAQHVTGVGFNRIEDFIQTDASVNPGMSGGALVDANGNLVGMLSAIFTRQSDANIGVNFAVSGALLDMLLKSYLDDGAVKLREVGIMVRPNDPELADGHIGAQVMRVQATSMEETAGLQAGDIILKAGERRIKRAGAYEAAIAVAEPGTDLDLIVLRGENLIRIVLKPQ